MPLCTKQLPPVFFRLLTLILLFFFSAALSATADERSEEDRSSFSAWSPALTLFQKYISKADGDRCPMHPSCSHYAGQAFKRHGAVKGWILTCDRLLRCGHDEVRLSPKVRVNGKLRAFDPVEANTRWWRNP
jgi:putative component of membrane protein insertase Oxa1/YidC/SpoIIIJ protein YidD